MTVATDLETLLGAPAPMVSEMPTPHSPRKSPLAFSILNESS